jgi:hypothetical protein
VERMKREAKMMDSICFHILQHEMKTGSCLAGSLLL